MSSPDCWKGMHVAGALCCMLAVEYGRARAAAAGGGIAGLLAALPLDSMDDCCAPVPSLPEAACPAKGLAADAAAGLPLPPAIAALRASC